MIKRLTLPAMAAAAVTCNWREAQGTMKAPATLWARAKEATAGRVNHPVASRCTSIR